MMRSFLKLSVAYVVSVFVVLPARPQELTVAAAADLRPALEEISAGFEKTSRVSVRIVYGSSGSFYEQIENGAPFDFFLSANADYPQRLESAGLALANSYYEYAQGKLVLLTRMDSKLDLQKGLQVLLDPAVKKIAIADPNHAPYGQAAVAALKTEGLYERISAKIVTGENVSQATSYVSSGAAEVGLLAKSLA
jgi:molybdate transport system substrate-binding protein